MAKHSQPVTLRSQSVEHGTPDWLFDRYDALHHFTVDAAATGTNRKCERYWSRLEDGLTQDWTGEAVWCNPPYGAAQTGQWARKAAESHEQGGRSVLLVPARTDTQWFHRYVWDDEERCARYMVDVDFLEGRVQFDGNEWPAPFPSIVITFWGLNAVQRRIRDATQR